MMQSAEMEFCDDPADALNFTRNRRVFVERQMRPGITRFAPLTNCIEFPTRTGENRLD
jgi:hypothetical protein